MQNALIGDVKSEILSIAPVDTEQLLEQLKLDSSELKRSKGRIVELEKRVFELEDLSRLGAIDSSGGTMMISESSVTEISRIERIKLMQLLQGN